MTTYKKNNNRIVPEILAPAGTIEALQAAVNAGCDAVYLGGSLFSARAFAGNFDTDAMIGVIDYCHLFGVKVYMTVNTLLKENEITRLAEYMTPFYRAGLDGVIVQDPGVVRVLQREFPLMPVHGSTQMSVASAYGAILLKKAGITRVVPARELSLKEIKSIKEKTEIEIETFVHGAMCYAYSGKCLMSSFLGGRSGNRGRCAQPCRQCYEVSRIIESTKAGCVNVDTIKKNSEKTCSVMDYGMNAGSMKHSSTKDGRTKAGIMKEGSAKGSSVLAHEYAMSLKDMCTLSILPRLIDAGIDSFKIEGRMKNPCYVAATVSAYRKARDYYLELLSAANEKNECFCWEELPEKMQKKYMDLARQLNNEMQDIYNRGGFHDGYYHTEKGMVMTANKRPNHLGLKIGQVVGVSGPEVIIKLEQELNPKDVLEITPVGIELTSNVAGRTGSRVSLKGKELKKIKPGMIVYRTRNNKLLESVEEDIIKPERCVEAKAVIHAAVGEPLTITLTASVGDAEITAELSGGIIEKAGNKPTDKENLISKMQKTGGSNVRVIPECHMDNDIFVPMSEFNNLRRDAMELLKKKIAVVYHRV